MVNNLNQNLENLFLEFETKTLKLRLKANSKIYNLFKIFLGNWRFLVTTNNLSELIRKLEIFKSALLNEAANPFLYGSKKKKLNI